MSIENDAMQEACPHKLQGGAEEKQNLKSAIRELIFGAEDGLVSILGLVTGVAAGTTSSQVVLLAGTAGAISGAISMAAGNYLGVKSEIEVLQRQLHEEAQSIKEHPEHERAELVEYYRQHGMTPEELKVCVSAVTRNPNFLMEEMAAHEYGISPKELKNPAWRAFWIFAAYILAAIFPVLPYAFFPHDFALVVSIIGTVITLFAVGAAKTIYTRLNPIKSGLEMLGIAALAGIAGFVAGHFTAAYGM
ncbi:MAG: VIT1/CCC1 transporter family protein [Armatimonadota bacterium]|nr:VIT1/CCC1 transporter family protein [Armatimonadota bacterium]